MNSAAKELLEQIVNTFGDAIENDESIDGADAVDQIVAIYHQAKAILSADAAA